MSSKLKLAIWSHDIGHIVIHGEVDGRTVTKTKFYRTDVLPLTHDAPRARLQLFHSNLLDMGLIKGIRR